MKEDKTYTIDASGKALGRVASEAAKILMGKTRADYVPHVDSKVKVTISNAGKLSITEKKRLQKIYTSYTGYPGGFNKESLQMVIAKKGNAEALRRAISRMIPRNTMKVSRMKHLTITN